jgi:hypothetical protein
MVAFFNFLALEIRRLFTKHDAYTYMHGYFLSLLNYMLDNILALKYLEAHTPYIYVYLYPAKPSN